MITSIEWYNPNGIHFLLPNSVAFISQKEKNVWFLDYHLLTCSVRKMVLICLVWNIDMCLLYQSHQIARLVSYLINHQENATKSGSKHEILHILLCH